MDIAVYSSLLYGLEHCAVGAGDQRSLDGFFIRLAKRVLHLPYDYHLLYEEAEDKLGIQRPAVRLTRERLQWTDHMLCSDDEVLREVIDFIPEGRARGHGRPRLRFYDTVKADLKGRGVAITGSQFWAQLKELAANRIEWQKL